MDGLVEELLRLEGAKHKALVTIDASAYDATVREQMRVLATTGTAGSISSVERLLVLSRLITLNTRLLQNLLSTTPFLVLGSGYTAAGRLSLPPASQHILAEA